MAKYGICAKTAAETARDGIDPLTAWRQAARAIFPHSPSSQIKGCPRDAFLGLCEDGLVKGVPRGSYTKSRLNKSYALQALGLLRSEPDVAKDDLWHGVQGYSGQAHNGQMDVVLTLWRSGLLEIVQ
jgi:hypothetical protein